MTRLPVVLLAAAALLVAGCGGGDDIDPDTARLREADSALRKEPGTPRLHEAVIRAAYAGVENRTDKVSGAIGADARPFLDRAAAVWPRYVRLTRGRPNTSTASLMSRIYEQGLGRPRDAAAAALFVAQERPSAESYIRLAELYSRSGDRRRARLAGQKALELAEPGDRERISAAIRLFGERGG